MNPKVEIFITEQKEDIQEILWTLRSEIINLSSNIEERFTYGIPFYYYHKPLCYLNSTKDGVNVGFYYGTELIERKGFLEHFGRKQIKLIPISNFSKFNFQLFHEILHEAILINESKMKKH